MIERKILCRIALTRALYDQIRPYFFQKHGPNFESPSTAQNHPKKSTPPEGVGGPLAVKKEKTELVLFVSVSLANRINWN